MNIICNNPGCVTYSPTITSIIPYCSSMKTVGHTFCPEEKQKCSICNKESELFLSHEAKYFCISCYETAMHNAIDSLANHTTGCKCNLETLLNSGCQCNKNTLLRK